VNPACNHLRFRRRTEVATASVSRAAAAFLLSTTIVAAALPAGCATERPAEPAGAVKDGEDAFRIRTVPPARGMLCYDFGTGAAWPDFLPAPGADNVRLSPGAAFGAYDGGDFPDPLAGDWAGGRRLSVTLAGLRKGSYRGALIARNVVRDMVAGRDFQVRANGIAVVEEEVPPEHFFSKDGFFYGVQFDDVPGVDWWERYVKPVTQWRRFEFESNGRLTLDLENCRLYALIVAPKADFDEKEFGRFLAGTQAARKAWFLFEKFRFAPERPRTRLAAPQEVRDRGYVVFARPPGRHVSYNTVPSRREMTASLQAAGTPGERLPVTFSIRALKGLAGVRVRAGDLEGDSGLISAKCISVEAVRYKLARDGKRWLIRPEIIQKQPRLDVPAGVTKRWWLTVHIPEDAAPGVYRGAVSLQPGNAPPTQLEIALRVYPFTLLDAGASFGVWYEDPWISSYCTGLVGGVSASGKDMENPGTPLYPTRVDAAVEEYRLRMLDADMALLNRLGFNGVAVEPPRVASLGREGAVTLDFGALDPYGELFEKFGINTDFPGQTDLMLLSRRILAAGGGSITEFSAFHRMAYRSAVDQLSSWWHRRRAKVLGLIVDEPSGGEDAGSDQIEAALYYLELVRSVGGMEPTVTMAYDSAGSVSWRPILDFEQVVQLKPWVHTRDSLRFAREAGKPVLFYDGGFSRYAFGFHVWAGRAEGHWQHGFNARRSAFNPIWEAPERPAVYPSPDGPLSTPRLESAAQGIVDYRYVRTLQHYISLARDSSKPEAAEAAETAGRTLREIRRRCRPWALESDGEPAGVAEDVLDKWRSRIAANIIRIKKAL